VRVRRIDPARAALVGGALATLAAIAALVGCAGRSAPAEHPAPVVDARPAAPTSANATGLGLAPPQHVRSWAEVRLQAAQRMVAANPGITYTGTPPDMLLAIPVLEIELNADGSVRRIEVLRPPRQAQDTVQIATDAVRRAAPFGDVSKLPRPWKFVETFLFDDQRRFKPRTLDH
jgi:hypothetical protein